MKNLTIKSIPKSLYERLKARAEANRRSLNSEVIHALEGAVDEGEAATAHERAVRERARLPYASRAEGLARSSGGAIPRRRLADLPALLASLPSLDEDDAARFREELAEARAGADTVSPPDPWAS